jgi:amylosucrase
LIAAVLFSSVKKVLYTSYPLRRMIAVRKDTAAFADFNNRELLTTDAAGLFAFLRSHPELPAEQVLVVANFSDAPSRLEISALQRRGRFEHAGLVELLSGAQLQMDGGALEIPPFGIYWIAAR